MGTDEIITENIEYNLKQTVFMNRDSIVGDDIKADLDIRVVLVNPVNNSGIPSGFDFDDYLKQVIKGYVTPEKHDEFLHIVYEPFKNSGGLRNGFWAGNGTENQPKNLIESYTDRFTECFGDKGRNIVTSPIAVREIVERMHVNGRAYTDYYDLPQINKMNYLEIVCDIIENLSRGEVAKSFGHNNQEHIIVTFRPTGKDYVNVYLPENVVNIDSGKIPGIFRSQVTT